MRFPVRAIALALLLCSSDGLSQEVRPEARAQERVERGMLEAAERRARGRAASRRIIELEGTVVYGRYRKPHVFYVIERRRLEFEGLPLERNLVKEIENSAKQLDL